MFVIIFFIIFFLIGIIIQVGNETPIDLNFLGIVIKNVPISFLLLLFMTFGVILSLLLMRSHIYLANREISKLKKENKKIKLELKELRTKEIDNRKEVSHGRD